MQNVFAALDASALFGLKVTTCHTGYNASVAWVEGEWAQTVFGTSASEAIAKALALRPVVPLAPPPY